jgi:hypothetical protein
MKTDLKKVILSNLESLIEKMKHNEGISIAITQRLTFEKWLQIELAGRLNYHLKYETDIKVVLEAPITSKMSKRAKSVDISIQRNNEVCNCNYRVLIVDDNEFNLALLKQIFTQLKIVS